MLTLRLIVAMTRGRLMGRANALPWHVPEDLRFFKASTLGQTVLMGRNSFDSLGRALPKRTNVVVSRSLAAGAGAATRSGQSGTGSKVR